MLYIINVDNNCFKILIQPVSHILNFAHWDAQTTIFAHTMLLCLASTIEHFWCDHHTDTNILG